MNSFVEKKRKHATKEKESFFVTISSFVVTSTSFLESPFLWMIKRRTKRGSGTSMYFTKAASMKTRTTTIRKRTT